MKSRIPEHILKILEILEIKGAQPYLVGGCVRDTVMEISPHDYDITVLANPQSIIDWFEECGYRTIDKGKKFGTIGVLAAGEVVEITPYRTESDYNDSRHPEKVEFVSDIKLDLSRRDFTVNAMAMNVSGEILDIFGGRDDVRNKIIRCVGVPIERFSEDALRILRAIRFAARFGFSIAPETMLAMQHCKALLHNISSERIHAELEGALMSSGCYEVLVSCKEIITEVIPGFAPNEFLKNNAGDFALRLFSCIYRESYERVSEICNYLKLSTADKNKILALHILYYNELSLDISGKVVFDKKIKQLLCDYPTEYIKDLFLFTSTDTDDLCDYLKHGVYKASMLAVSGGEIASLGIFPQNLTGKVLHTVLYNVAEENIKNTKEEIIAFIKNLEICDCE